MADLGIFLLLRLVICNRLLREVPGSNPGRAPNNLLRFVTCNRFVNLGISKQQHLYLKTEFNLKTQT